MSDMDPREETKLNVFMLIAMTAVAALIAVTGYGIWRLI